MAASEVDSDFYAILQVHPDAEPEVIEAAYRGLMKKYHPDVAADDPVAVAERNRRAIAINAAYRTLRDPELRRRYDLSRFRVGARAYAATPQSQPSSSVKTPSRGSDAERRSVPNGHSAETRAVIAPVDGRGGPFGWLAAAYYLLPGPYEWDRGRRTDGVVTLLVPVVGVLAFALGTGRLNHFLGDSFTAGLLAWTFIVALSLPLWPAAPRIGLAVVPSLLMLSEDATALLRQAQVPPWSVWGVLSLVSLFLSARLYVFAVLPTIGLCWLITVLS